MPKSTTPATPSASTPKTPAAPKKPARKHTKQAEKERAAAASGFATRLREARRKAGYAILDEAAKDLGVTREGYGRLERGRIMPRADLLLRLARLFRVSVDWLLGLSDKP